MSDTFESVLGTMENFFALLHSLSGTCVHIWDQAKLETWGLYGRFGIQEGEGWSIVHRVTAIGSGGLFPWDLKKNLAFDYLRIILSYYTHLVSNVYFLFQSSRNCSADLISMIKKLEKHYLTSFFDEKSNKLYNGRIENVLAHFLVAVLGLKRIWRKNYH